MKTANGIPEERIKRRAKKIVKEHGVKHTYALDVSSREFGFSNYKDFLNQAR